MLDHTVDEPIFSRLRCAHEVVALGVALNLLKRATGVGGEYTVKRISRTDYVLRMNLDIRCLTLCTAERLVDHNFTVRKCKTLAACS